MKFLGILSFLSLLPLSVFAEVSKCEVSYEAFDGYKYMVNVSLNFTSKYPPLLDPAEADISLPLPGSLRFYALNIVGQYAPPENSSIGRDFILSAVLTESTSVARQVLARSETRKMGNEPDPFLHISNPQPIQIALDNGYNFEVDKAANRGLIPKDMLREVFVRCWWP